MNVPCFNCERREMGCHSACEDYKIFQTENEKRKAAEREESEYYGSLRGYKNDKYKRLTGRFNT